jgi:hypothetical protein
MLGWLAASTHDMARLSYVLWSTWDYVRQGTGGPLGRLRLQSSGIAGGPLVAGMPAGLELRGGRQGYCLAAWSAKLVPLRAELACRKRPAALQRLIEILQS